MSPMRSIKPLSKLWILLGFMASITVLKPALGQDIGSLNQALQQAVAAQNWDSAIQIIDKLMIAAPEQRPSLEQYRNRLSTLRTQNAPQTITTTPTNQTGRVPIKRRDSGVVIIDATFNQRKTFDMLLDSGASVTVITRPMAKSLGIRPEHVVKTAVFSTANGRTELPIVYLKSVNVGGLVARDVPVAVAGPEMDIGLLGQDFLQRYDVTIKRDSVEFNRR